MAHVPASSASYPIRRKISRQYWTTSLSRDLQNFVVQLLPSPDELAVKEDVRKLLERLIRTIEPESRLLSFGSTANGFSLRNSDMDLCCLIDSARPPLNASDLVTMKEVLRYIGVGSRCVLISPSETKFQVKTLPHARIPIVKLSLDPSPGFPYGISCDIGFENRLALENTRLLMSYASIDPLRVRTLVIFRTSLMRALTNPPVLPNLQQMPPLRPISHIIFRKKHILERIMSGAASIRAGLLKKSSKGWQSDQKDARDSARERNRLCIEDPFETDYNVARCVTKEGLYTIRGEFMRASRILAARPERTIMALAQLCEERDVEFVRPLAPQPFVPPRMTSSVPTAPQSLHVQAVTHGLDSLPPTIFESIPGSTPDLGPNLTSGAGSFGTMVNPNSSSSSPIEMSLPQPRDPPAHMAPRRAKWTSPPPPDDPDRIAYEDRLGAGLSLATSSSAARQPDRGRSGASSSSSEILTDEDHEKAELESVGSFVSTDVPVGSADLHSIDIGQTSSMGLSGNLNLSQSFPKRPLSFFGPPEPNEYEPSRFLHHESSAKNPSTEATEDDADGWLVISTPKPISSSASASEGIASFEDSGDPTRGTIRGRPPLRFGFVADPSLTPMPINPSPYPVCAQRHHHERSTTSDSSRRSLSGPPALRTRGGRWANFIPVPLYTFVPGLIPNEDQISTTTESIASPNTATTIPDDSVDGSRSNSGSNSSSSSIAGLNTLYYSSPPSTNSSIRTPFPLYQATNSSSSSATPSIFTFYTKPDAPLDTAQGYPVSAVTSNLAAASTSMHPETKFSNIPLDTTPLTTSSISASTMPGTTSVPAPDNPAVWHREGNGHAHFGSGSQYHPFSSKGSSKAASTPFSITTQHHLANELQRAYDTTPTPKSREKAALSPKNTNTIATSKDRNATTVQSPSPRVQATQSSQTPAAALEALLPVLNENAGHLNFMDDNP
ncbi:hypothetical protein Clacol_003564 [Clathrus columnatus]|uniref:Poly(A) RNA polymerase mitochondrial-like central palm domain-containing protein n=1 Tax=Clathrus columnatus TaxID=1419009 RepID=A0AAV5A763_9AGAM|nr:hypothetical protein Clacol_003564 [Clathrus columnatus]